MATKQGTGSRKTSTKRPADRNETVTGTASARSDRGSSSTRSSSGGASALRSVVAGAASSEALLDLVERLGLVDLIVGRVRSRIEEIDVDDLLDEVTDYLRRNPEVLVVTLGAATVTTGLLVWLASRRTWDEQQHDDRRGKGKRTPVRSVKKSSRAAVEDDEVEY